MCLLATAVAGPLHASCTQAPSVSAQYIGPSETGAGTLAITYAFPDTTYSSERSLVVYIDGHAWPNYYATGKPDTVSGTWNLPMNTTCWTTGAHSLRVVAQSCSSSTKLDTWTGSVSVNTKPEISATYTGPDAAGNGTRSVDYRFPNTATSTQRDLNVYIDGKAWPNDVASVKPTTLEGNWTIALNATCWSTGTHPIRVTAQACGRFEERDNEYLSVTVNTDSAGVGVGQRARRERKRGTHGGLRVSEHCLCLAA
jgi:hypothetical protein